MAHATIRLRLLRQTDDTCTQRTHPLIVSYSEQ